MNRRFIWDEKKAETNIRKHGISFEKAVLVFDDPLSKLVQDRIVDGEERWQIIGMVEGCLLVIVAHTYQEMTDTKTEVVRIINARTPTKQERRLYEHG